ncbi:MAG: hypothetical protein OEV44_10995, partial [Spirochaetota bacterium]|nr:hypothetical protein [Spirochaetota bacterium]
MKIKLVFLALSIVLSISSNSFASSKNIKYYKNRVRSSNLYSWEYLNPVSEKEIDAQNIYFAVSY